jgi:competence protein ComEA
MKKIRTLLGVLLLAMASSIGMAATVNVNTATAGEIAQVMSGVGEKKAQAIVADREANGAFKSLEEISRVKGIGMATIDKNRENITLK